jgi:hypothetical protein
VLFWNQFDLQRKLEDFKVYYNQRRVHCSLNGNPPHEQGGHSPSKLADLRHFAWTSERNGLFQDTNRSNPVDQRKVKNSGHIIVGINSKATERLPQAPTANDVQIFHGASPGRASGCL